MFNLNFASLNIHGMTEGGKRSELEESLLKGNISVCFLQETFLKSRHLIQFDNYLIHRNDRHRVHGGGTAILVRNNLVAQVVPVGQLVTLTNLEVTAVVLKLERGRKLFCLSVYNRSCLNSFDRELTAIFEKLCLDRPENLYVIGGTLMLTISCGVVRVLMPGGRKWRGSGWTLNPRLVLDC